MLNLKANNSIEQTASKKNRLIKARKSDVELIRLFWSAPIEAYFDQFTIAPVIGCTPKTMEYDRWKKRGIPFRKVSGRILYQKHDVVHWLESHKLVTFTSEYDKEEKHG